MRLKDLRTDVSRLKQAIDDLTPAVDFKPLKLSSFSAFIVEGILNSLGANGVDIHFLFSSPHYFQSHIDEIEKMSKEKDQIVHEAQKNIAQTLREYFDKYDRIQSIQFYYNQLAVSHIEERKDELLNEINDLQKKYLKQYEWIVYKIKKDLGVDLHWYFSRENLYHSDKRKRIAISGIYVLCSDNKVDYVGESGNIKQRLNTKSHHVFDEDIHLIGIIEVNGKRKRLQVERSLIALLDPEHNKQYAIPSNQASFLNQLKPWR